MTNDEIIKELEGVLTGFWLTDLSNFAAHFYEKVPQINWIGFYLTDGERLRLGPFNGKVACTGIDFDRGVCGHAFTNDQTTVVDDVHQFKGHITCDPQSRSELVIPLHVNGELCGVLDIDSPVTNRFAEKEIDLFTRAVEVLTNKINYFPSFHESQTPKIIR